MRLKTTLRSLSDMDVRFVSLVDRGANRIPFRVIKSEQENPMLDLSKLGMTLRKADTSQKPAAPEKVVVKSVVVDNADPKLLEEVKAVLKAEGLEFTKHKVFDDGTVSIFEEEVDPKDTQVISVGDHMAVVVKGFEAYANDLSLTDAVKARGFFDNIRTTMNVMSDKISTTLYKSADLSEAKTSIAKDLREFDQYMMTLVDALPASVFKAESKVDELISNFVVPENVEAEAKNDAETKPPVEVEKGDKSGKPKDEMSEEDKKKMKMKEDQESETAKILKSVQDSLELVTKSVSTLAETVTGLVASQKSTEEKVAEAITKADTATRAVSSSVVVASDTGGDPVTTRPVRKSEDPRTGVFDSAFLPR